MRSVGEAAKTILKNRNEEIALLPNPFGPVLVKSEQDPVAIISELEKSPMNGDTIPEVTIQKESITKNCSSSMEIIPDNLPMDFSETDK